MFGLYWGSIRVIFGLYLGYISVIFGVYKLASLHPFGLEPNWMHSLLDPPNDSVAKSLPRRFNVMV